MLSLIQISLSRPRIAAALALCGLAQAAHAEVLTVGIDPATHDFINIQAAVNNAQAGDTILVGPGEFTGFQVTGKPLTILGAGSDLTRLNETYVPVFGPSGTIRVSQVNEGRIRIGGFTVDPPDEKNFIAVNRWVLAEFCDAPVELFDIQIPDPELSYWSHSAAGLGPGWDTGIVSAQNCRRLILSDVNVTGYAEDLIDVQVISGITWNTLEGYSGLSLETTFAWVINSHFEGCTVPNCASETSLAPIFAGVGARLWNSRLIASNSHFEGARGYGLAQGGCFEMSGGSGMDLKFASQVQLLGGPDAAVIGGDSFCSAPGGSGVVASGPASVLYAASSMPQGGVDQQGLAAMGITEVAGDLVQVLELAEIRPSLIPGDNFLRQGETFELSMHGNPGGVQVVLWQGDLGDQLSSPLLVGDLFLDPSSASMLGVFGLDGTGQASTTLQVPLGNEFVGISIAMQTTELVQPLFYPAPPIYLATRP